MSERGYFCVDRGLFDHPIFAAEPFTEREAWVWLISEAAWKPKRIRTPQGMISVERGQVVHSQRFLATKWHWDRSRVRRFLALLEAEGMLTQQRPSNDPATTQQRAHETTHLTICNYDKYQLSRPGNEPSSQIENEHEAAQNRPKEEKLKTKTETIGGAYAPDAEGTSRAKPKRTLPDIFPVTDKIREYAEAKGYKFEIPPCFAYNKTRPGPAQDMFTAFKNYHTAKGTKYSDWEAAWRMWVNKQVKFDTDRGKPPGLRPAI